MSGGKAGNRWARSSRLGEYLVVGIVAVILAGVIAAIGWLVTLLVGGALVWVVDALLPDPNGVWDWWYDWYDWITRAGALMAGAAAIGYIIEKESGS